MTANKTEKKKKIYSYNWTVATDGKKSKKKFLIHMVV